MISKTDSKGKVYIVGADRQVASAFFMNGYNVLGPMVHQEDADILVYIGGTDLDPSLYRQKANPNARVVTWKDNDNRDMNSWRRKRKEQLAVGICRGGQFLNVMSGGSMIQHCNGHNQDHEVFDTVWNQKVKVASSHHQMMVPGLDAEVFAYAEGVGTNFMGEKSEIDRPKFEPEVLYYESTKSLCYQGHPEWSPQSGTKYFFDLLDLVKDC